MSEGALGEKPAVMETDDITGLDFTEHLKNTGGD